MYIKKIEDIFFLLRLTNKSVSNNQSLIYLLPKDLIRIIYKQYCELIKYENLINCINEYDSNINQFSQIVSVSKIYWDYYLANKTLKNESVKNLINHKFPLHEVSVLPMSQHKIYDHLEYYARKNEMIGIKLEDSNNSEIEPLLVLNRENPYIEYCYSGSYCSDIYFSKKLYI